MFDLYDIYDTSEITIIVLIVFIFVLALIIFMLFIFSNSKNVPIINELPRSSIDYEKKYNELIEKKGEVPMDQLKYSPSEFATLLKFTMRQQKFTHSASFIKLLGLFQYPRKQLSAIYKILGL